MVHVLMWIKWEDIMLGGVREEGIVEGWSEWV